MVILERCIVCKIQERGDEHDPVGEGNISTIPPGIFQELVHSCPLSWIKVHHLTDKCLEVGVEVREALLVPKREGLPRIVLVKAFPQFNHS